MINDIEVKKMNEAGKWQRAAEVLVMMIVFGSIWGFSEATLGGFLHLVHFPYKGAIMGGIGMSIMATFVATHRRPSLLVGLAFVAALFKPLSALIYVKPIFAPFVVNPATAIILEGLTFSLVTIFIFKGFEHSIKVRVGIGLLVGYLSIISWGTVASIMGTGNWALMGLQEKVSYALINGTALAIIGVLLLPLGYMAGTKFWPMLLELKNMRPKFFYTFAATTGVFCWFGAGLAFVMGL
ncbi:hypothetical protein ACFLVQ_00800 [Chloroflexota bacterium]